MLLSGMAFASGGGGQDSGGDSGAIKMDLLVVNLDQGRYVGFTSQIKLADPLDEGYVKACSPMLRHEMIKLLIGQNSATVQTAEFIANYAQRLGAAFNKLLGGDYIKDVFFDKWIVQ
jgi:flagellar basal body-associated protein FliL